MRALVLRLRATAKRISESIRTSRDMLVEGTGTSIDILGISGSDASPRSRRCGASGRRSVAFREAQTAQMALVEHLRGAGCRDGDIVRIGPTSVAWLGAVYRAHLVDADSRVTATSAERRA
jgi:hypothetical protein